MDRLRLAGAALCAAATVSTTVAPAQAGAPTVVRAYAKDLRLSGGGTAVVKDGSFAKVVRLRLSSKNAPRATSSRFGSFVVGNAGRRITVCVYSRSNGVDGGIVPQVYAATPELRNIETTSKKYASRCFGTRLAKNPKRLAGYQQVTLTTFGAFRPTARTDYVYKITLSRA